jgi:hypothetical protein
MWYRRLSWPHISALCSGEDDKDILVDREACGEVSSKRGKKDLFRQLDEGFAILLPLETLSGVLAGGRSTLARPIPGETPPNWQDRGIIPEEFGLAKNV